MCSKVQNKERRLSEEHKKRISKSLMGHIVSDETRKKMNKSGNKGFVNYVNEAISDFSRTGYGNVIMKNEELDNFKKSSIAYFEMDDSEKIDFENTCKKLSENVSNNFIELIGEKHISKNEGNYKYFHLEDKYELIKILKNI